ncbi:MAG: type II toxin-antitoxin system PemK/MazF family toxin [Anaerolineales bacterium]|nr:type II toxin-antitoxin system PemK/MazF family toxin [Anaerolineales bacterium]
MVDIRQGDIWWANLPPPQGSEPGFRRPVLVVQRNELNESRLNTTICVVLTSNLNLARIPENVLLSERDTNLPKPSVAVVSQLLTTDKRFLEEHIATVSDQVLQKVLAGIEFVLGR